MFDELSPIKEHLTEEIEFTPEDFAVLKQHKIPISSDLFRAFFGAVSFDVDPQHGTNIPHWYLKLNEEGELDENGTIRGKEVPQDEKHQVQVEDKKTGKMIWVSKFVPKLHWNEHVHTDPADQEPGSPHAIYHELNNIMQAIKNKFGPTEKVYQETDLGLKESLERLKETSK